MKTTFISIVLFCAISFCAYSQLPTNGLVGHWPFNGNASDTIGHNDGIVNGATLCKDRFGIPNRAYYFDGINDNISLLFNNSININTNSTIMVWFKANQTLNSYAKLLCVPYSLTTWGDPYHYLAFSGTAFNYANFDPTNGMCETGAFTEYGDTVWNLLTFTYDNGDINVYINNVLKKTLTCTNTLLPSGKTMSIGSRSTNPANDGEYFTGIIDDISFYNRVLTQDELTNYYNKAKCIKSNTDKISTYYVPDSNFKKTNSQIHLDSTVTKLTNTCCDSIINYYSKFEYRESYHTDTLIVKDTITITDTLVIKDTITVIDTMVVKKYVTVTDTLVIDITTTGLNQHKNSNSIKVYPNPTNDVIHINTGTQYQQISNYTVKIINQTGGIIFESKISKSMFDINLKDFGKTGLYYIQIIDNLGNITDTRKIILK